MKADRSDSHVYVALILAFVAAITSTVHTHISSPVAATKFLLTAFPEAGTFAAAQGEPAEVSVPP
jgi:hypothetical protein